ncbi:MAG: hypothetical protein KGJ86_13980 [Chloroflexota bacterium]|nr:hypothetical protein [Chloroflexota bacterium]
MLPINLPLVVPFTVPATMAFTVPVVIAMLVGFTVGFAEMAAVAIAIPSAILGSQRLVHLAVNRLNVQPRHDVYPVLILAAGLFIVAAILAFGGAIRRFLKLVCLGLVDRIVGAAAGAVVATVGFPVVVWCLNQGASLIAQLTGTVPLHF